MFHAGNAILDRAIRGLAASIFTLLALLAGCGGGGDVALAPATVGSHSQGLDGIAGADQAALLATKDGRVDSAGLIASDLHSGLARLDLNGDGKSDLLWHNAATGQTTAWLMNGSTVIRSVSLLTDPNFKVVATPDLNGDGKSDLLWFNAITGQTSVWLMDGTSVIVSALLLTDASFKVVATPDLNGDGKSDLIWYSASTGQTTAWLMDGTSVTLSTLLLTDPNFRVIATPDLNGDGKADLIWYSAATGQTTAWLMEGTNVTLSTLLLTDPDFKVVATPDLNGDGKSDLIWYNAATGQTTAWLMDGTGGTGSSLLLTDPSFQVVATPDLNGDGNADLVWTSTASGQTTAWLMNGTNVLASASLLSDPNFRVAAARDLDGDGKADLIWTSVATGHTVAWLMDGTREIVGTLLLTHPTFRPVTDSLNAVAPEISEPPVSATSVAPAGVVFSVKASGTPLPTFQWQQSNDGGTTYANITGATSSRYATPLTVLADSGKRFRVMVSNSAGSVTSNAATLTVADPLCLLGGPPSITIDTPAAGATRFTGHVCNVDLAKMKVVVYVLTNQWYVQPLTVAPFTAIAPDGSWATNTHPWNAVVVLLVDPGRYTPADIKITNPALDPEVLAWAQYPSGLPISLNFSNRTWGIKVAADRFDPGPNYWSNDPSVVSVAADGLHLKINQVGGKWQSAEVYLLQPLGYGTYTVRVASRLDQLDRNTVAAPLFLYASPTQELDNEYSGAGGLVPAPQNAQFVVQPYTTAGNLVRYSQPATAQFTTQMEWRADRVVFTSWNGWASVPSPGDILQQWTYRGSDIPPPSQAQVRINLWLFGGAAPVSGKGDEMVINSFSYQP